ncbi:hypothetical protein RvY_17636, partial [Ramazzottius varieornatus]
PVVVIPRRSTLCLIIFNCGQDNRITVSLDNPRTIFRLHPAAIYSSLDRMGFAFCVRSYVSIIRSTSILGLIVVDSL